MQPPCHFVFAPLFLHWQFVSPWSERSRTSFEAAAELRRLHALNQELVEALKVAMGGRNVIHLDDLPILLRAIAKASGSATQTGETE